MGLPSVSAISAACGSAAPRAGRGMRIHEARLRTTFA